MALVLICKAPHGGIIELFRDLFDYSINKGTIHNIVHRALSAPQKINEQQDLSNIKVGAHDEVYQAGKPVLAGCCAHTTYCYLLSQEDSCDATAWGVHLLNLQAQGLNPDHTIADGGHRLGRAKRRLPYLKNYIPYPYARLDNNVSERALKFVLIRRKNWMFIGSEGGGEVAAIIYFLVQTCGALQINPYDYFEDILRRIQSYPYNKLSNLLPHNWKKIC